MTDPTSGATSPQSNPSSTQPEGALAVEKQYTQDELDAMSRDDLVKLGTNLDRVDIIHRPPRYPVPGTRAEKRAARQVTFWLILSGLAALLFVLGYLFWPHEYKGRDEGGYLWYTLYNPMLGVTAGLAILSLGFAAVMFTKRFIPEEISIQQRHDGPSAEVDRKTIVAELSDALQTSSLPRRKAIKGGLWFSGGALGLMALMPIGGLIKNPWKKGDESPLWVSGWTPKFAGETIYLRKDTGDPSDIVLLRPEDLDAGGMESVFPFRESDRGDEHALLEGLRGIRNSVMLFRFRTEDTAKVVKRKGQESFNYGDYFAFSKICTHLGCPTSLYEAQTHRILCPCHQSQFDALTYGKPVFGPAARALPQLPITVNEEGFLVANGDFIEALGPAFWERRP